MFLKVAVIMGGCSSEHKVSLASGKNIIENLDSRRYNIIPIRITRDNKWLRFSEVLPIEKILRQTDLAFNALHGKYGEDGRIQGLLDFFKIPYTGSGVLASALAMDKIVSRQIFKSHKILTPRTLVLKKDEISDFNKGVKKITSTFSKPPWVIKPAKQGSSVGISIIYERVNLPEALKEAFRYDKEVLAEEYLEGREFTSGILENFKGRRYFALPVTEIIPQKKYQFFDYEAKYKNGATDEITPANIDKKLSQKIQEIAIKAHQILGCSGYSRADLIVKEYQNRISIFLLEVNTLPGLTKNSLFPKAAKAAGLNFSELLDKIIENAIKK